MREALYEVESAAPREDAERLLRSFLKKAYRRPVAEADVQRFLRLFDDQFQQGSGFTAVDALGLHGRPRRRRASCSSRKSPAGSTDPPWPRGLALFLWNSVPDDALRALADRGELHRPDVLHAQAERMLDDPEGAPLRRGVPDYWLDLRKIDDTSPSTTLYNDYYLDDALSRPRWRRRGSIFAELLQPTCRRATSSIRISRSSTSGWPTHYGIAGVSGIAMRAR